VVDSGVQSANVTFDNGLALFKAGRYRESVQYFDAAVQQAPGDAVAHELRALALFAAGEYQDSAAVLNSLLAAAPGMDWSTMSGLYGDVNDYTIQLRSLEAHCRANPTDAAAYFVLAYHYLVTGSPDAATLMLKNVVAVQPGDMTAKRMLDALEKPVSGEQVLPSGQIPAVPEINSDPVLPSRGNPLIVPPDLQSTQSDTGGQKTDLVGVWRAVADGTTIELTVQEDSRFSWKASPPNQPQVTVEGSMSFTNDRVEFDSSAQGVMAGSVTSIGGDQWRFQLDGAPTTDPGLTFQRVR
jgi:tetratricopeptide (TPR) repeat protein